MIHQHCSVQLEQWLRAFPYHSPNPIDKAICVQGAVGSGKSFLCTEISRKLGLKIHSLSALDSFDDIRQIVDIECNGYQTSYAFVGGRVTRQAPLRGVVIVEDIEYCLRTRTFRLIQDRFPQLGMPMLFTTTLQRLPRELKEMVISIRLPRITPNLLLQHFAMTEFRNHPLLDKVVRTCNQDIRHARMLLSTCRTPTDLEVARKDDYGAVNPNNFQSMTDVGNRRWSFSHCWQLSEHGNNLTKFFCHYLDVVRSLEHVVQITHGVSDGALFAAFDKGRLEDTVAPAANILTYFQLVYLHRPQLMWYEYNTKQHRRKRRRKRPRAAKSNDHSLPGATSWKQTQMTDYWQ